MVLNTQKTSKKFNIKKLRQTRKLFYEHCSKMSKEAISIQVYKKQIKLANNFLVK